tara:strand:- start:204 stop:680 length:477 start_codon:yes stop_codon:yes gene_type:complete
MKNSLFLLVFSFVLFSCGAKKNGVSTSRKSISKADKVVANALHYEGVKYKYGGTTKRGMDCSGVIYVAFGEENFQLPRVSHEMAKEGKKIALKKVAKGDLLFFKTRKSYKNINHVGLVVSNKNGQIRFIHSTTSKGVIVSLLSQKYWAKAFVKATRVL